MHKKWDWPQNWLLMKNLQFWSNLDQTLPNGLSHLWELLTKFHQNWTKIVDFSLIAKFEASLIFYASVFIRKVENTESTYFSVSIYQYTSIYTFQSESTSIDHLPLFKPYLEQLPIIFLNYIIHLFSSILFAIWYIKTKTVCKDWEYHLTKLCHVVY